MAFRISPGADQLDEARIASLKGSFPGVMERLLEGGPVPAELARSIGEAQLVRVPFFDLSFQLPWGLDPNIFGISLSLAVFALLGRTAAKS
jgi:hypothetical protein